MPNPGEIKMIRSLLAALAAAPLLLSAAAAQEAEPVPPVAPDEVNVVYGMASGAALLMDVYHPDLARGLGIIVVPGSGWYRPEIYAAPQLKDLSGYDYMRAYVHALNEAGFTVFVINHRSHPGFRYPVPVEDTRRAVRFVRAQAERFGIDPERIGIMGHSSGGNLAAMAGVLDDTPGTSRGPVDQTSAAVQAVAALAAPFDLTHQEGGTIYGAQTIVSYIGEPFYGEDQWYETAPPPHAEASPVTHVDGNDPPFLIAWSANDPIVPPAQARQMIAAMEEAGARFEAVETEGEGHQPALPPSRVVEFFATTLEE